MKPSTIEKLLSIAIFVLLFFSVSELLPFVVTNETYSPNEQISGLFPIVVEANGTPRIIRWHEYENSKIRPKLFLESERTPYPSSDSENFTLEKIAQNKYALTLATDDYIFWSKYTVVDGEAVPENFRYSGAFVVFYALIISVIGVFLFRWARRYYRSRHPCPH